MIQRIQSIYFLLAILAVAFPLFGGKLFAVVYENNEIIYSAYSINYSDGKTDGLMQFYVPIFLLMVLLLFTIFSFKNRKRQISLGVISFILSIGISCWMTIFVYLSAAKFTSKFSVSITPGFAFVIFAISFFFIFMGIRGVRKDKKLVDSLDRIR